MEKIQEYFRGRSVIKTSFIIGLILGLMVFLMFFFVKGLRAEDNETKKVVLKEWTTQLLYDTTNACYSGTIRWIVLTNPSLIGQAPDFAAQRQMMIHCFCVMDRIRNEIKIEDYQKLVYDPEWTGNTFMIKAMECVGEDKTLPSFFVMQGGGIKKYNIEDNKTITIPNLKAIPKEEIEDLKESPDQQQKESDSLPETIFQG